MHRAEPRLPTWRHAAAVASMLAYFAIAVVTLPLGPWGVAVRLLLALVVMPWMYWLGQLERRGRRRRHAGR